MSYLRPLVPYWYLWHFTFDIQFMLLSHSLPRRRLSSLNSKLNSSSSIVTHIELQNIVMQSMCVCLIHVFDINIILKLFKVGERGK